MGVQWQTKCVNEICLPGVVFSNNAICTNAKWNVKQLEVSEIPNDDPADVHLIASSRGLLLGSDLLPTVSRKGAGRIRFSLLIRKLANV